MCMDADFDICIEISACAVQDILRSSVSTAAKIQIKSNFSGVIERDDRLKDMWRSQFLDN